MQKRGLYAAGNGGKIQDTPLERSAALMKWKMVGEVLIPGVLNTGDIQKTDGCRLAAALADKF